MCGWGTILLVFWLARRILGERAAVLAMFVMATSIYFLKYAARGMTDVPFTFLCLCSIGAWLLSAEDPRWYLVAGLFAGLAQITRGLIGIALPLAFGIDVVANRRRPPVRFAIGALGLTFVPVVAWYAHLFYVDGAGFLPLHLAWLDQEVYGKLSPSWRRYTGAFEYVWMILKSYWPWLPFMAAGMWVAIRSGERRLRFLVIWIAAVFVLCAAAKSRVLRYMLPAYPAFAILAAVGLQKLIPERYIWKTLRVLTPILAAGVIFIAIFPRRNFQATEIRLIATAATAVMPAPARVVFYDDGQPRFDETNQLQWYGSLYMDLLLTPDQLVDRLKDVRSSVFIVDRETYRKYIASQFTHQIVQESGHLICLRLPRQ
jgi:4-amino-4-deoxy-L-arabinose transferase-like glycosyltransferase